MWTKISVSPLSSGVGTDGRRRGIKSAFVIFDEAHRVREKRREESKLWQRGSSWRGAGRGRGRGQA